MLSFSAPSLQSWEGKGTGWGAGPAAHHSMTHQQAPPASRAQAPVDVHGARCALRGAPVQLHLAAGPWGSPCSICKPDLLRERGAAPPAPPLTSPMCPALTGTPLNPAPTSAPPALPIKSPAPAHRRPTLPSTRQPRSSQPRPGPSSPLPRSINSSPCPVHQRPCPGPSSPSAPAHPPYPAQHQPSCHSPAPPPKPDLGPCSSLFCS